MRLTKIRHVGLRFLEPMDDMTLRVLNNAIAILRFYGLFYRIYLPIGQDSEFPPQTTHFAIKGVNALLVT